jgi:hypothetical protein
MFTVIAIILDAYELITVITYSCKNKLFEKLAVKQLSY